MSDEPRRYPPVAPVHIWEGSVFHPPDYTVGKRERWVEVRIVQSVSLTAVAVLASQGAPVAALLVPVLAVLAAARVWPLSGGPAFRFKLPGALGDLPDPPTEDGP